jgi:alkylhydroperoxidase family enzyme
MRLPYVPDSKEGLDSESSAIYDRIAARRAPRPLQALDLTLFHSPNVADGWNNFLGAIRTRTSLLDDIREIAICRVAVLNGAAYEWVHHAPLAKEGGVSEEGMKSLGSPEVAGTKKPNGFSDKQWAVVRYSDAMTRDVKVSEEVFGELKKQFSEQEIVEITATVRSSSQPYGEIDAVAVGVG